MLGEIGSQRINISATAGDCTLGGTLPACQIRRLQCENAGADDYPRPRSLMTVPGFPAREQACGRGDEIRRRERRPPQPISEIRRLNAYACRCGTYNKPRSRAGPRGRVGGRAASALERRCARAAPATRPRDRPRLTNVSLLS